jgi:clorobiocin biosynthesis protein CloN5
MTTTLPPEDEVSARLLAFIRERFLAGDPQGELTETTPLLEWGILNSLNTALLLGYIRENFDTVVPLEKVDAATFKNVASISALLRQTAAEQNPG